MSVSMHAASAPIFSRFILPNSFFHASMTYGLLRHGGVALGKIDFLGSL